MTLAERLREYVQACFSGLWIQSHEHSDALAEIARLCRDQQWRLARWDCETGLSLPGQSAADPGQTDPLAVIRSLSALATAEGTTTLVVLQNFHRFLQSAEIIQSVANAIVAGRQSRVILVILDPIVQLPPELERLVVSLDHELPTRDEILAIARGVATEPGELPGEVELAGVLDAASGLTRLEAENAFAQSLVRHQRITPETLWELKGQALRKSSLLSLSRGGSDFSSLGGLSALKAFCRRALLRSRSAGHRGRGVLLLSPPGCGKSAFARALGRETQRPVLQLDVGALLGSLVGQSEERTRQALKSVDAMAPCILMLDEIEKGFAGLQGTGDSGVVSRMFGTFLTWLNDHTSDVFVVATSNDASKLPPEFSRAERFDGVFFVDLPDAKEREAIWRLHRQAYGIAATEIQPDDDDWTGAEIQACCRLSAVLDLPLVEAAQNVVPVAVTAAESIDRLRGWASGRCLSASHPGVFRHPPTEARARRRVQRDPLAN